MWTHVYVQQANSVFAGNSKPGEKEEENLEDDDKAAASSPYWDPSRRHHDLHYQHNGKNGSNFNDTPSGEDQTANFYGVSHFPCCITNFPQGWPKFAQHVYLLDNSTDDDEHGTTHSSVHSTTLLVASLVPANASFLGHAGQAVTVMTSSQYPFGDNATVNIVVGKGNNEGRTGDGVVLKIRIPGWAVSATIDGESVKNGTTWSSVAPIQGTRSVQIELRPVVRAEFGWGDHGVLAGSPVNVDSPGATTPPGALVPTGAPSTDFTLSGGASVLGSKEPGFFDLRSGSPGQNSTAIVMHPIGGTMPNGKGHFIVSAEISFRYVAGYTPGPGQPAKKGSQIALVLVNASNSHQEVATLCISEPLDKYSFDNYKGYSPPILLKMKESIPLIRDAPQRFLLQIKIINNERNLQIQFDPMTGLNATIRWDPSKSFLVPGPYVPPSKYLTPPRNSVAIVRGPIVFALHPNEKREVVTT